MAEVTTVETRVLHLTVANAAAVAATRMTLKADQKPASGDLSAINLAGLVTGGTHFSVTRTLVTVATPALSQAPLLTLSLSAMALRIGSGGFGLSISGGTVTFAALADPTTGSTRQWIGFDSSGLAGALTPPQLTATLANGGGPVNSESGQTADATPGLAPVMGWTRGTNGAVAATPLPPNTGLKTA